MNIASWNEYSKLPFRLSKEGGGELPVNSNADASCGWHANFKGIQEVFIHLHLKSRGIVKENLSALDRVHVPHLGPGTVVS